MRPTAHDSTSYANDMASLSRMLRRAITDKVLPKATRLGLERNYREAIRLLSSVALPSSRVTRDVSAKATKKRKKPRGLQTEHAMPNPVIMT